jgi:hypothetical protein
VIDAGSCFAGSLFELALAADRSYMLAANDGPTVTLSAMNDGPLPMSNGLSRFETRFLAGKPEIAREPLDGDEALEKGLVTFSPDEIDWEDEVRLAIEERASLSPTRSRHGGQPPLRRARDDGDEDLRPAVRLAELDLPAAERGGGEGRLDPLRQARAGPFTWTRT